MPAEAGFDFGGRGTFGDGPLDFSKTAPIGRPILNRQTFN